MSREPSRALHLTSAANEPVEMRALSAALEGELTSLRIVKTTPIQTRPETAARLQKLRAANALILAAGFFASSPFFFSGTTHFGPFSAELRDEWPGYLLLCLGASFVVRAAIIRFRTLRS